MMELEEQEQLKQAKNNSSMIHTPQSKLIQVQPQISDTKKLEELKKNESDLDKEYQKLENEKIQGDYCASQQLIVTGEKIIKEKLDKLEKMEKERLRLQKAQQQKEAKSRPKDRLKAEPSTSSLRPAMTKSASSNALTPNTKEATRYH